jgi:hypothetical protein
MTGNPRPTAPRRDAPMAALLPIAALLVAACAAVTVTQTPATSPADGRSPDATGDVRPAPTPTWWPGGIVINVIELGKADGEILKAGADLGTAAANQDLPMMRGAADGLATLLERMAPLVDRIRDYPATAAAAQAYDASLPIMLEGARQLRDAIDARDPAGITAASQKLGEGLQAYQQAREAIGPLVDRAILMQRLLVK